MKFLNLGYKSFCEVIMQFISLTGALLEDC